MPKLMMMVGLSGSGKTQYAKELTNAQIFSSDAIRVELFGDESDQTHNSAVFAELHKRIKDALQSNQDVVYDATNLSRKRRMEFLSGLGYKLQANVYKSCCIMAAPVDICVLRNMERERHVPPSVIVDQWHKFETPCYWEGFDFIYTVNEPIFTTFSRYLELMHNFKQDNSHHEFTLLEHCNKTAEYIKSKTDNQNLILAAQLHDIGKLWTKTFSNYKGEPTKEAHYYSHNNVGAYESLLIFDEDPLPLYVSQLICYHMLPYQIESEKAKDRWLKRMGKDFYDDIMLLHEADKASHLSPSQEAKGAI